MSTIITQSPVILVGDKDWDAWKALIHTYSMEQDLWKYINPSTSKHLLPELTKPLRPEPKDVKAPGTTSIIATSNATSTEDGDAVTPSTSSTLASTRPIAVQFSQLTVDEKQYYQTLLTEWQYDIRKYDRQLEALAKLRAKIQSTIHRDNFIYTQDCETVWDMMSNLRRRFAPSDKAREQDVLTAWKKAIKKPIKGMEIEKWVQDLETAYDRAVELNLPAISGINPHYELI
jgi:hypothetical protein